MYAFRITCWALIFIFRLALGTYSNYNYTSHYILHFILLQRRFDASCIIFKLQVRTIRITFTFS